MKVVEAMVESKFEVICDAGAELVKKLQEILKESGLEDQDALAVLAMAAGGVFKGSPKMDPKEFISAGDMASQFWRHDPMGDGLNGMTFDPPHRQDGYEPQGRTDSN